MDGYFALFMFCFLANLQGNKASPIPDQDEVDIDMNVDVSQYGLTVKEFDILVDPEVEKPKRFQAQTRNGIGMKRKAKADTSTRWTDNTMVYKIKEEDFTVRDLIVIDEAMENWEKHTCIKFRKATDHDKNFVHITDGPGCSAHMGMKGGEQQIFLKYSCRKVGIVVHEIGHALGFYHEHMRPDRDKYIKINFDNIREDFKSNFVRQNSVTVDTYGVPYDYLSVMHYGPFGGTINGKETIEATLQPYNQDSIGQRYGLSFHDAWLANEMYKCSDHCPKEKTCHSQAFLGKDCKCYCRSLQTRQQDPYKFTSRPTVCRSS